MEFEFDKEFLKYAARADELEPTVALDVLSDIYIDNCGISLSDRTAAENAAFFWIRRWRELQPELPEHMGLYDVMAKRSERYRSEKERIDKYDVTVIEGCELHEICMAMMSEYVGEDTMRIALCAGLKDWIADAIEREE